MTRFRSERIKALRRGGHLQSRHIRRWKVTRHQSVANLRSETGFAEWCRRSCAAFICAVVAGAASMPNADVPSPVRSAAHLQNRETRVTGLWQHTEVLPASWPTAHEINSRPAEEP